MFTSSHRSFALLGLPYPYGLLGAPRYGIALPQRPARFMLSEQGTNERQGMNEQQGANDHYALFFWEIGNIINFNV